MAWPLINALATLDGATTLTWTDWIGRIVDPSNYSDEDVALFDQYPRLHVSAVCWHVALKMQRNPMPYQAESAAR